MEKQSFSIKEALSIGWRKSWDQAKFLFGLFGMWVGYIIIGWAVEYLFVEDTRLKAAVGVPISLATSIIGAIIGLGVLRIYYDIYMTGVSSYKQLYESRRYFFTTLFAGLKAGALVLGWILLSGLAIFGVLYLQRGMGLGLYIIIGMSIPCAFVLFRIFAQYIFIYTAIISDDVSRTAEALKLSKAITKGHRVKLLWFGLLSMVLVAITFGFLASVVGIAWMHVYKQLRDARTT